MVDSVVKLLLEYIDNTDISRASIRNLLEIITESKLSLKKELKIDSEFKVDFTNSDHDRYLSSCVIIALLRSAINKKEKQNTPDAEENGAGFNDSNEDSVKTVMLNGDFIRQLYNSIAWDLSSESLQLKLSKQRISLQSKCEQGAVLGNTLLEHAIKHNQKHSKVIKFLLENGVTIINAIGQEGRYYVSKTEENKSILCSVVSDTDDSNAEILSTLLQNINAEQSKLNHEDELYKLYQQLKDDAFCTAFEERNSVAATVLIQNDQERIASHESAVNGDGMSVVTETDQATIPLNIEEDKPEPSGNVGDKPVPPISTKETNADQTAPSSGNNKANGFIDSQFLLPNEKETKYKESKENFYTSLKNDAVGVVITGLFITAAVMIPSVVGAVICGIVAALVAITTILHATISTLPSYREMEENKVESWQDAASLNCDSISM